MDNLGFSDRIPKSYSADFTGHFDLRKSYSADFTGHFDLRKSYSADCPLSSEQTKFRIFQTIHGLVQTDHSGHFDPRKSYSADFKRSQIKSSEQTF